MDSPNGSNSAMYSSYTIWNLSHLFTLKFQKSIIYLLDFKSVHFHKYVVLLFSHVAYILLISRLCVLISWFSLCNTGSPGTCCADMAGLKDLCLPLPPKRSGCAPLY